MKIKRLFLIFFILFNLFVNTNNNTHLNTHTHQIDNSELIYEHSHAELNTNVFIEVEKYELFFESKSKLIQAVKENIEKLALNSIFRPPIF